MDPVDLERFEVHIGLAGQTYQAFMGLWDDLATTTRRTIEILAAIR